MKEKLVHILILVLVAAVACALGAATSLVGLNAQSGIAHAPATQPGVQAAAQAIPEMATAVPTSTLAPSRTPTSTPTVTPTRDPRIMLSRCGAIEAPGLYQLNADLRANGDCISVQTSRVVLDCAGHSLDGTGFAGYGIVVRKYGLLRDQLPADVEVRNCRLSNFKYGIYVEGGTRLLIHDNDSSGNYDDVDPRSRYGKFLGMTEGGGIRLDGVSEAAVVDNRAWNQAIGIDVRDSHAVTIHRNTASYNSAWGINLVQTRHSLVSNNIVADNIRYCTWGAGVIGPGCDATGIMLQDGSSNNVVVENMITGDNGNGIFIKAHALKCGDNNTIIRNTILGALYNSIELGFCQGNKINYNVLRNSVDGVLVGFAQDTEIRGNTIENMKNHGILSPNSQRILVTGNEIVNSNEGIYFYSEHYDRQFFAWLPPGEYVSKQNCLCGNTLRSNSVAIRLKDSTDNRVTDNRIRGDGRGVLLQGKTEGTVSQEDTGRLQNPGAGGGD